MLLVDYLCQVSVCASLCLNTYDVSAIFIVVQFDECVNEFGFGFGLFNT